MTLNPFLCIDLSISDSLRSVRKSVLIYETIIPCLECEQCGEKYYTDEVAERLEIIVNMAKKLMQEIAVIDYPQVA